MIQGTVTVAFYRGRGPICWAVRADCRRPKQPWNDVPGHVAVIIDKTIHEFIVSGYHTRPAVPSDYAWSYDVAVTDLKSAWQFANSEAGDKYGDSTIALIILSRFVPGRWLSFCRHRDKRICSWFALRVLIAGGWECPHWLMEQYEPEVPNDILFAVREVQKVN